MPQAVLASELCRSGAVFGCCYKVFKVQSGEKYLYLAISFRVQLAVWSTFLKLLFLYLLFQLFQDMLLFTMQRGFRVMQGPADLPFRLFKIKKFLDKLKLIIRQFFHCPV